MSSWSVSFERSIHSYIELVQSINKHKSSVFYGARGALAEAFFERTGCSGTTFFEIALVFGYFVVFVVAVFVFLGIKISLFVELKSAWLLILT
jgi:hypothetical protein